MISTMYTQQQMAPAPQQQQQQKPTIQKVDPPRTFITHTHTTVCLQLLDDNSHLISVILDYQTKGRQLECLE